MTNRKIWKNKRLYWVKIDYSWDIELFTYDDDQIIKANSIVVIETKHGMETGKLLGKSVPVSAILRKPDEYSKIIKKADEDIINTRQKNIDRTDESFEIANQKIQEHKLPLKLLHIHHFLDDKKVMFYFYCENRVDFRSLVRELASIFKVRIELRQVGVRDEAMYIGGYGVCGRQFCCTLFGTNKDPKSIKMAREQNLTLNSMRISGVCGRLLCCLDFEYDYYHEENFNYIKEGTTISLNNEMSSTVVKIDKDKGIISLQTDTKQRLSVPIESITVNHETGKCTAYI